ncbi:MAG: NAD(+) salvage pathway protein [Icmadophila ericetorum]|nr:NAD(+) salvage pathway protein [Icmadophila ericetorum]
MATTSTTEKSIKAALVVVDMQEDFCPPNGSLAVTDGRDIAPVINDLLDLPFTIKVATKDWHPLEHISFHTQHQAPNNVAFVSKFTMTNPVNSSETKESLMWPVHCVQGTNGAEIIPEINTSKIEAIVEKGRDKQVEMYSGFSDAFGNKSDAYGNKSGATSEDLAALLKSRNISHVYIVGLAGDYCVRWTAQDARREGFENVYVIEEAVRSVDPGLDGWGAAVQEMKKMGVELVSVSGPEVGIVKSLG